MIAKAEEPPPEGSTASRKCLVLLSWSMLVRFSWSLFMRRARKASTSVEGKALLLASAEMPSDSRKSMAGSSESRALTVSIFCELSQRGIL